MNVYPFILRGVRLLGIDSVQVPMEPRERVWKRLAGEWKPENLESAVTEVSLDKLNSRIDEILAGKVKGRTVVNLD
jgi:NADPH:quinone reductase-like Zn-dependent oxidoreductase